MHRLLPFMLFVIACRPQTQPSAPAGNNTPVQRAWSYLALGDSYTIGQGVTTADRFPAQTVQWLQVRGVNISMLTYLATTGWTTTQLQNAILS